MFGDAENANVSVYGMVNTNQSVFVTETSGVTYCVRNNNNYYLRGNSELETEFNSSVYEYTFLENDNLSLEILTFEKARENSKYTINQNFFDELYAIPYFRM